MNRILVAVEPAHGSVSAAVYALNLAQRIQAKVSFLLICASSGPTLCRRDGQEVLEVEEELKALLIDSRRSTGLQADIYVTHGSYENELINFVQENRITLLVIDFPPPGLQEGASIFLDRMMRIKREINCRVVIVSEKTTGNTIKFNRK